MIANQTPTWLSKATLPVALALMPLLLLLAPAAARADIILVTDVIPVGDSAEVGQNSEPSLAVNPLNPSQMIAGTFATFVSSTVGATTPYYMSTNGGATWTDFGTLNTFDKSLAWQQDGVAALNTTLNNAGGGNTSISTYQSGATNFGAPINTFNPSQSLDQPWIRTGPSAQTYVAYNNLSNASGKTASIIVSSDNGNTYGPQVTLETVAPAGGQDAPSVRQAVNGSTVYAAFTRWGTLNVDGVRYDNSQVVVVKSTNSGASFSAGVTAATTTGYFANASNTSFTLGQERTSSDVAIAVDPNNANHVLVAYGNAPASGQIQLNVTESTDGGTTWTNKFTTSSSVRSALPALSILANGTIGFLYYSFDATTNQLSQHFLQTADDFATTNDSLLGTQSNATPTATFFPYVGDFVDLTSVGNTFDGIFSASNADNGTLASFASVSYQRDFTGTPGAGTFQLVDASNNPVAFSIDPYVFSVTAAVPEPASLLLVGSGLVGLGAAWRRRRHT